MACPAHRQTAQSQLKAGFSNAALWQCPSQSACPSASADRRCGQGTTHSSPAENFFRKRKILMSLLIALLITLTATVIVRDATPVKLVQCRTVKIHIFATARGGFVARWQESTGDKELTSPKPENACRDRRVRANQLAREIKHFRLTSWPSSQRNSRPAHPQNDQPRLRIVQIPLELFTGRKGRKKLSLLKYRDRLCRGRS
jgi:hypothetical protein